MNYLLKIILAVNHYTWKQRVNLIRILFIVFKASIVVKYLPLRYYFNKYFEFESTSENQVELQPFLGEICYIKRICNVLPWRITCLMESIIVMKYLKKYDIRISIFLGVKTEGEFRAHAWYSNSNRFDFNALN